MINITSALAVALMLPCACEIARCDFTVAAVAKSSEYRGNMGGSDDKPLGLVGYFEDGRADCGKRNGK
jgi:hypothetical protein